MHVYRNIKGLAIKMTSHSAHDGVVHAAMHRRAEEKNHEHNERGGPERRQEEIKEEQSQSARTRSPR